MLAVTLCVLCLAAAASQAVAVPLFSETNKQAVFLSPLEQWWPTWNLAGYVYPLEKVGYHVDVLVNENVSIAFLKTELAKYDVIIMRTASFSYEGVNFLCSGEPITSNTTAYASGISSNELHIGVCLGFSSLFLRHNYGADSLRHGLVFMLGSGAAELSSVFLSAGSAAFVGFYESFSMGWGSMDAFTQAFLKYLSEGNTVKEAIVELDMYLYSGHGSTANWLLPYWSGDGDFKL
jgi:hypothetical protein